MSLAFTACLICLGPMTSLRGCLKDRSFLLNRSVWSPVAGRDPLPGIFGPNGSPQLAVLHSAKMGGPAWGGPACSGDGNDWSFVGIGTCMIYRELIHMEEAERCDTCSGILKHSCMTGAVQRLGSVVAPSTNCAWRRTSGSPSPRP